MSDTFKPLPRTRDPYLLGEGGNCGVWRLPDGRECPACLRRDGEWHQRACPYDGLENAMGHPDFNRIYRGVVVSDEKESNV